MTKKPRTACGKIAANGRAKLAAIRAAAITKRKERKPK